MKTLHSLELKNGVLFKDATLRLDHVGLTTIRGMNLDAKKSSSASNGSGKSHLLSFLPELLFDSTPLTKEIKSRTKKDRLVENSTSTLLMSSGDSQYKIIKKGSKKGFDIDIEENGKDIGLRTKSYTKDKIEYLFNNITEDEFYTLWYIDSRRPSDLQFGSPAKRMEFFTRLFRLESFDSVRKLFNTMAAEAKQNKTVYMKLKEELEKFKLDIVDDSEYKIKLKKLMRRQEKITEEIELLIKQNQKSETLSKLYPDFAELKSLSKELGVDFSLKQVTFAVKQFSLFLERAEKIKKQRTLYEDYLSRLKKYNSAMSKTKNIPYTLKDLRLASEKKKELTKLKSEYLNIKNASVSINENKLFKLRDSVSIKDLNKVKESRDKIRAEVLNLKESIDTLKDVSCNHGESFTCPTCYQKVEASEKIIASLEKSLKEKQSIFKKYDEKYRLILELQTLENDYEAFTKNRGHLSEVKKELKELLAWFEEKKINYEDDLEALCIKLERSKTIEKPEEVKKPKKLKNYKEKKAFVELASRVLPHFEELLSFKRDSELENRIGSLKNEQQDINSSIVTITSKLALSQKSRNRIAEIKKDLKAYKQSIEDLPILQDLIEAYSNKGIKLLLIKRIAQFIEANMNKYASLLYFEKVRFTFTVTEKEFSIKFERTYKGKKKVADVRLLSGAESRAFTFLFPLSIMPLIPASRRINLMVLDEPTVNMDEMMTDLFINSFIPKLNSMVPHVIVITPLNEHYKNSRDYFVIKKGGISSLVSSTSLVKKKVARSV